MAEEIELAHLDLRYESYRVKHPAREARLLAQIAERGIDEPLEGVDGAECSRILLDGFKRYRSAKKLGLGVVPYTSLGQDEVSAILVLLRTAKNKALSILEQAAFVDELKNVRDLSLADIAAELSRSKAWVSMRAGLIAGMSDTVRQHLFGGAFPAYSYMYTLRPFMRMNDGAQSAEIEQFVEALSGKKLSTREIEQLAYGYFRGPESYRQEVLSGNLTLALEHMDVAAETCEATSDFENAFLRDLETVQKYTQKVMRKSADKRLKSRTFHCQCHLLTAGMLSRASSFLHTLRQLHDRSGQA